MRAKKHRKDPLQARIRALDEELRALDKEIRQRQRGAERPLTAPFAAYREEYHGEPPVGGALQREEPPPALITTQRSKDERFTSYLASSFQQPNALRHERRLQRNKAIVVLVVALLALFWVLWQLLH
jgi:hypothetical protein